jgi:hypothetical protein
MVWGLRPSDQFSVFSDQSLLATAVSFNSNELTTDHCSLTTVLPARLVDAGDFALERQRPETQTADTELAEKGPRPSAELAPVVFAAAELRLPRVFYSLCSGCHKTSSAVSSQPSAFSSYCFSRHHQLSTKKLIAES